jgi:hypothetical protein
MKTHIKTLTLCAVVLAGAIAVNAQYQNRQERPNRKQEGFNCPVCDSPCINKTALQQKLRQRRMQTRNDRPVQREGRYRHSNMRWQTDHQSTAQRPQQRSRWQEPGRFDLDGDGTLSYAEKAARRAYRNAAGKSRGDQPNERPDPQPPVE